MRRMHGIDAFSIYIETPTSPFETVKVLVYRPVTDDVPAPEELRDLVKALMARLGDVAAMRIVRVPLDLHHPVWVLDDRYRPDEHIHHATLPAPGGKAELSEFVSDLLSRTLDPDRPRWEAWILDGLEGGALAVVLKIHHALADGRTVAALIEHGHTAADGGEVSAPPAGEPVPGTARLVAGALVDLARSVGDELPTFYREAKRFRQELTGSGDGADDAAATEEEQRSAPFTVLNRRPGGGRARTYRYEQFPLADFKAIATAHGCTINTLVLGVCSEALKRYLADIGDLPDGSLMAAMPVSDKAEHRQPTRLHGDPPRNSVSAPVLPLHQQIEDFGERLLAIKRSASAAAQRVEAAWGKRFDNVLEFLPGAVVRGVFATQRLQQARGQAYANLVVSNVPGPRQRLYALGGRLELVDLLSSGNLTDFGNLNVTVWSYAETLTFSFYLRTGALPDPEQIPRRFREVFEELRAAHAGADAGG